MTYLLINSQAYFKFLMLRHKMEDRFYLIKNNNTMFNVDDSTFSRRVKKYFTFKCKSFEKYIANLRIDIGDYLYKIKVAIQKEAGSKWDLMTQYGFILAQKEGNRLILKQLTNDHQIKDTETQAFLYETNIRRINKHLDDKVRKELTRRCVNKPSFRKMLEGWDSFIFFLRIYGISFNDQGLLHFICRFCNFVKLPRLGEGVNYPLELIKLEKTYANRKGFIDSLLHKYFRRRLIGFWYRKCSSPLRGVYPIPSMRPEVKRGKATSLVYFAMQWMIIDGLKTYEKQQCDNMRCQLVERATKMFSERGFLDRRTLDQLEAVGIGLEGA